mmetsp:Transcript_17814/g.44072  ORF Transcript_17814/g.44072 Transcript_17814/m.44072 type:complete len:239 (-) Transcript_17814:1738-2454(-)
MHRRIKRPRQRRIVLQCLNSHRGIVPLARSSRDRCRTVPKEGERCGGIRIREEMDGAIHIHDAQVCEWEQRNAVGGISSILWAGAIEADNGLFGTRSGASRGMEPCSHTHTSIRIGDCVCYGRCGDVWCCDTAIKRQRRIQHMQWCDICQREVRCGLWLHCLAVQHSARLGKSHRCVCDPHGGSSWGGRCGRSALHSHEPYICGGHSGAALTLALQPLTLRKAETLKGHPSKPFRRNL